MVPQKKILAFQNMLFSWYADYKRSLPWRATTDPYAILVSEVMLQQTQVDRVISKYETWLQHFPDFFSLASASRGDVLKLWSGLGYNSRAVRLHTLAQDVVTKYVGVLPMTTEELFELPGIGPYTCKSVLIFAYNFDLVCVDTNIRRILISSFNLDEQLSQKELEAFAQSVLPLGCSRDWHNALMDYGALVLTSSKSGIQSLSKQSPFLGSRRMYRGKIIKLIIEHTSLSLSELCLFLEKDETFVSRLVIELVKEGLVVVSENVVSLP